MIRLSWVVFLHAVLLSVESIVIELLATQLSLAPLVVAGNSILIAGAALLAVAAGTEGKRIFTIIRSWKYLLPASLLLAVGVYAWYDYVTSVGASKEGLLAGPLETVVILVLAGAVLKEKLTRPQMIGVLTALGGFFATVMSAGSVQTLITWGDIEAMISAVSFAAGIIIITVLTRTYSVLLVTGSTLFISGLVLAAALWTTAPTTGPADWVFLLAFSILPLSAALTYVMGLRR
ncbi:MAG: EamA family transporter, partial [Nitrososphaera sp.]